MKNDNAPKVLNRFINLLNIPISYQSICNELEKHPDYPSWQAITDVLKTNKIQNGVYSLTFDELFNIPFPFIAHLSSNGGEFVVVRKLPMPYQIEDIAYFI